MDISHLRYFLALCKEKNYTSAADACFITRQAMKQSVTTLEKFYGVRLVTNEKNKLTITESGRLLEKSAKKIVAELEKAEQAIVAGSYKEKPLRVGVGRALFPYYAPDLLKHLEEMDFTETEAGTPEELLPKVISGELDCALVIDDGQVEGHAFHRAALQENIMLLLMNRNDPLAQKEGVTIKDLDERDLQIMSDPEAEYSCFSNLRESLKKKEVSVRFHAVADYYSVHHHIVEENWIGVDRSGEDSEEVSMDLAVDRPFENGKFKLYISLISLKDALPGVRMLENKLRHRKK